MNKDERLNLAKMINVNNVKDQTDNIKKLKHSSLLLRDVNHMCEIKRKYSRLSKETISDMCFSQCSFLSSQYMDIYNKLLKDGILTKKGLGIKGYNNYLRITLGPPRQIKTFISKLKNFKKS